MSGVRSADDRIWAVSKWENVRGTKMFESFLMRGISLTGHLQRAHQPRPILCNESKNNWRLIILYWLLSSFRQPEVFAYYILSYVCYLIPAIHKRTDLYEAFIRQIFNEHQMCVYSYNNNFLFVANAKPICSLKFALWTI